MAILSRAAGTPVEGAETTWGLRAGTTVEQVPLMTGFEHPAPSRTRNPWPCAGEEIVHSRRKRRTK
jgi:hypothetical protein